MWRKRVEPSPEVMAKVPREEISQTFGIMLEGSWDDQRTKPRVEALGAKYGFTFDEVLPWIKQVIRERDFDLDWDNI